MELKKEGHNSKEITETAVEVNTIARLSATRKIPES